MQHKGWHSRGYLPHFDSRDVIQFVTYRLGDSLPQEAWPDWQSPHSRKGCRTRCSIADGEPAGCAEIAEIVENAFLAFDGTRYRLHAWTVMPNHVHVLFTALPEYPLGTIVSSWKRCTAREANKQLGRNGAFWQADYWDRFVRNETHFEAAVTYIDQSPVKAGLVDADHLWPHGSARFRG